jgi:hypothetical protein
MPHILIQGCDMSKSIHSLDCHVKVSFRSPLHRTAYGEQKLEQLREKLEAVFLEYFDDLNHSEHYTNHQWNENMQFNHRVT